MAKKREILAACDLSEFALPVLKMAGTVAEDLGRNLIVAHVIHRRDIDSVAYAMRMEGLFNEAPSPEEFVKKITLERVRDIRALITLAGLSRNMPRLEIAVGNPFEALMRLVESKDVYMAVIGTKGRGNIADLLAGSTAQKLLNHCTVPLLCVPKPPVKQPKNP
jgi:nucleotide-binding universal stress UspA family protein